MEKTSPLRELCGVYVSPISKPQFLADLLIAEEWINSTLCLSVVSHSCLLREAVRSMFKTHLHMNRQSSLDHDRRDNTPTSSTAKLVQHWILLDYSMGHKDVITTIQRLYAHPLATGQSQPATIYLVILELKDDPELILDCIEAGAHGYALQGASGAEILQVIKQVERGQFHYPLSLTAKLVERLNQAKAVLLPSQPTCTQQFLTPRELEVLHYIAQGWGNRAIATHLVIQVRTVKHHVHNLLQKLQVKSRWQAAQVAMDNGWLAKP